MKKIMGLCLAMVLVVSFSSVAFADLFLVHDTEHKGDNDYAMRQTSVDPANGKKINIYVDNRKGKGKVEIKAYLPEKKKGDKDSLSIPAGKDDYLTVNVRKKGKFWFEVKRSGGHPHNIMVRARQY